MLEVLTANLWLTLRRAGVHRRPTVEQHMLPTIFMFSTKLHRAVVLCGVFIICVLPVAVDAHAPRRNLARVGLPRVGTIKDYPATGLMTGCGNLYFYPAGKANSAGDAYIFLARGDGSNAWMNLNGRDVRLQQIKSRKRGNRQAQPFHYRFGKLLITVTIEAFKKETEALNDGDPMARMRITLRVGRAVRVLRAVGGSDC
jgi:hypothetical protein